MDIYPATSDDNSELQHLQGRCPQGTTLVVSTVNTPDFFARVKAYEDYQVYIASEDGKIVGSAACAVRDAVVGGKTVKIGHQFQAFVHPDYRGRRIAGQLLQVREQYLKKQGAALAYVVIMEGNIPSMRHVERQDYNLLRTIVMPVLPVYREMEVKAYGKIRAPKPDELETIADLVNRTWKEYELYEPMSADRLSKFIARTPGYDFDHLSVLEENGEIVACLGFWDWSQVTRIVVEKLNLKMRAAGLFTNIAVRFRPMPHMPEVGKVLKQMVLAPIAFHNPRQIAVLLRHTNNLALLRNIEYIHCVCDRTHPFLKALKGFFLIDTAMHIYMKPLQEGIVVGNKPIFMSGIDL